MKILYVIEGLHKAGGGTSEIVPRMCEALVSAGHEVRLIAGRTNDVSLSAVRACEKGVDVRYSPRYERRHFDFWHITPTFRRELVRGIKWCDVVHIHGLWMDVNWLTPCLSRRFGKPYFIQTHGFLEPERLKKSKWKKRIVGTLIERPNLNRAAAVIATSESEKRGIEQYGVRVPIEVVPLGMDTASIDSAVRSPELLSRLGFDPTKKTLLYFSRLTPIKGLDLLAEAWAQLTELHGEWQLLIAGPDDRGYAAEIRRLYKRTITDGSVIFSDPIYGDEKNALLKSVDAFVLPTRSENWSIAVQEALVAGIPVVCTKGAPWKVIADEGAGEWVDVNAAAIREGLRKILSADDATRCKMGEIGKRIVARDFGWDEITKKLIGVYEKVRVLCKLC